MSPQFVLEFGVLAEVLEADRQETGRSFLARGEQEGRRPHDVGHVGGRAVGVGGEREVGQDITLWLTAAVFDVLGEPIVEPLERIAGHALALGADLAG